MSRTYFGTYVETAIDLPLCCPHCKKDIDIKPDVIITQKFINKLNKGNKATEKLKRKKAPKEVEVTESKERLL